MTFPETTDALFAQNPLREGARIRRTPDPSIFVIFGATGDLAYRKLVPALFDLAREGLLPPGFTIVGVARRKLDDNEIRSKFREGVERYSRAGDSLDPQVWESFARDIHYFQADFDDSAAFERLGHYLDDLDQKRGTSGNRVYYLAIPPAQYEGVIKQIGEVGLSREPSGGGFRRIVVEKPFGRDLASARALNAELSPFFDEGQVYRIDHYLGKETVQNILVFRFANSIFEPLWNRQYIDHVQITVAENIGVEGRGGYYEGAGALRDMVQNHMLQLLSLLCMEPPVDFDAESVRDEKTKVLQAIRDLTPENVARDTVRGQYAAGSVAGKDVPGYLEEPDVAPDSKTETFVALRLFVDNWRWAGVPFYLRSGKRLPKRSTELAIQFREPPHLLFAGAQSGSQSRSSHRRSNQPEPTVLVLRIQPDEGISLRFEAKLPGPIVRLRSVAMDFHYGTSFSLKPPEAYERLLLDCLLGDSTLYTRRDEVEAAWGVVSAILEGWANDDSEIHPYPSGSWGPDAAEKLIERDGREWRRL